MRAYNKRPEASRRLRARTACYRAEKKEELAKAQLARYYANHERELEKKRVFREANRETLREANKLYQREWRKKNPKSIKASMDKFRATEHGRHLTAEVKGRRRARVQGSQIGKIDWPTVWSTFNGSCGICTKPLHLGVEKFHFDHIVALSSGGAHSTNNLQVAHATCNLRKNRYPIGSRLTR
jgi:5-methylcytosine-specific restriction endonuclease McrA